MTARAAASARSELPPNSRTRSSAYCSKHSAAVRLGVPPRSSIIARFTANITAVSASPSACPPFSPGHGLGAELHLELASRAWRGQIRADDGAVDHARPVARAFPSRRRIAVELPEPQGDGDELGFLVVGRAVDRPRGHLGPARQHLRRARHPVLSPLASLKPLTELLSKPEQSHEQRPNLRSSKLNSISEVPASDELDRRGRAGVPRAAGHPVFLR